ncbi:MAG: ABC-2 transporter permease [Coriobacteriales bacterium]|nr:ABC-2 transporter permease [Coriobacteriales bacterium]
MLSLMYADWVIIRKTFLRYLLVTLIVTSPIVAMSNSESELSAGVAVAAMVVMMITIYLAQGLFAVDEAGDWDQFRLTLPTTAREVVRGRYAFAALVIVGTMVMGTVLGVLAQWFVGVLHGAVAVPRGLATIGLVALGAGLVAFVLLALEMPIVFNLGINKARLAFVAPFFLCLLFTVEPVRNAVIPVLNSLESFAKSLGSPAPLFAVAAVVAAVLYLVSMRISEHLYANRDF